MLHAGIEALFGRNRTSHKQRHLFRLRRRHRHHEENFDELAKFFLDKPNTKQEVISDANFVFASMQGWRSTMEDTHRHSLSLDDASWKLWSYFSIFDGHNGKKKIMFERED